MFETKKYIFKTDFYIVSETSMLRNRYFLAFLNQSLPVIFKDLPILRYDTVLFYASAIFLYKKLQFICVKLPHYALVNGSSSTQFDHIFSSCGFPIVPV